MLEKVLDHPPVWAEEIRLSVDGGWALAHDVLTGVTYLDVHTPEKGYVRQARLWTPDGLLRWAVS